MLRDKVKQYDKKYGSGNFLTLNDGQNQVRILTEPELYDDVINGQPGGSFISYVITRDPENGDSLALLNLSKVVIRWLAEQEELGKFAGYPMPHDIMIFKQKSGEKNIYVSVAVDPANSPAITSEQQGLLKKAKPIGEVAAALAKKKQASLPGSHANVPQIAESPAQAMVRANREKAEMNPMYGKLETAINKATTIEEANLAMDKVKSVLELGGISEMEADFLRDIAKHKLTQLSGSGSADDINVEDIPF